MNNRKSKRTAGRKAKPGCAARTGSASESAMLDFVGLCVNEINSIEAKGGWTIELIWYPWDDDMRITKRTAKTEIEAFRKCVQSAMQRMPNDPHEPRQPDDKP